jgi:hypothetical protein
MKIRSSRLTSVVRVLRAMRPRTTALDMGRGQRSIRNLCRHAEAPIETGQLLHGRSVSYPILDARNAPAPVSPAIDCAAVTDSLITFAICLPIIRYSLP